MCTCKARFSLIELVDNLMGSANVAVLTDLQRRQRFAGKNKGLEASSKRLIEPIRGRVYALYTLSANPMTILYVEYSRL